MHVGNPSCYIFYKFAKFFLFPSDDLLNYELGDDLDDQELAGDEDALLLSDEGELFADLVKFDLC